MARADLAPILQLTLESMALRWSEVFNGAHRHWPDLASALSVAQLGGYQYLAWIDGSVYDVLSGQPTSWTVDQLR